jgi:hypothetical protein
MKEEILSRVSNVVSQGLQYRSSYSSFSYLWVDDRRVFLEQFLLYGHVPTQEEIEQAGDEGVPEEPPTLDMFSKQVDSYEEVHLEVGKFVVSAGGRSSGSADGYMMSPMYRFCGQRVLGAKIFPSENLLGQPLGRGVSLLLYRTPRSLTHGSLWTLALSSKLY